MNDTCGIHTANTRCGRPVVKDISEGNGCSNDNCGCRTNGSVCAIHLSWMEGKMSTEQMLLALLATV